MKVYIYFLFLFLHLSGFIVIVDAQKLQILTEDYRISKDSCHFYIYELRDYLNEIGFCQGKSDLQEEEGKVDVVKKKLFVDGIDFSEGYSFILELRFSDLVGDLERYYGEFGIIEVGYPTEKRADEVFNQAKQASTHLPLNIPILIAPFRCVKIGKSVLFVYSTHIAYEKYIHAIVDWKSK